MSDALAAVQALTGGAKPARRKERRSPPPRPRAAPRLRMCRGRRGRGSRRRWRWRWRAVCLFWAGRVPAAGGLHEAGGLEPVVLVLCGGRSDPRRGQEGDEQELDRRDDQGGQDRADAGDDRPFQAGDGGRDGAGAHRGLPALDRQPGDVRGAVQAVRGAALHRRARGEDAGALPRALSGPRPHRRHGRDGRAPRAHVQEPEPARRRRISARGLLKKVDGSGDIDAVVNGAIDAISSIAPK